MPSVKGVVVTHGQLGGALVDAAEEITGVTGALLSLSNQGVGPADLRQSIVEAMGDDPTVVFVDLASGSCGFAANTAMRGNSSVAVVTGVSLPMLIEFLFHRDMELQELSQRLVDKGRGNIKAVSKNLSDDGVSPLPD